MQILLTEQVTVLEEHQAASKSKARAKLKETTKRYDMHRVLRSQPAAVDHGERHAQNGLRHFGDSLHWSAGLE